MEGNVNLSGNGVKNYKNNAPIHVERKENNSHNNRRFESGNNRYNEEIFMKNYANNFSLEKFSECISLASFEKERSAMNDKKMNSNSALRKVYDSYLDILSGNGDIELAIQIWFAKIGYQEKRNLFPSGFLKFLSEIYKKLNKDHNKFRDFLEVFVAYHKYLNPKAK